MLNHSVQTVFWMTDGSLQTTAAASDQLVFRLKEWQTSPQMFSNAAAETADGSDWWLGHWYIRTGSLKLPDVFILMMIHEKHYFSHGVSVSVWQYIFTQSEHKILFLFLILMQRRSNVHRCFQTLNSDSRNFLFGFVWISVQIEHIFKILCLPQRLKWLVFSSWRPKWSWTQRKMQIIVSLLWVLLVSEPVSVRPDSAQCCMLAVAK